MSRTAAARTGQPDASHKPKKFNREALTGYGFALPFFILFILSFAIPIVAAVYSSLFKNKVTQGGFGPIVPTFVGLENYIDTIHNHVFWDGMWNVVAYGVIKIPLVQGAALILALLLDSLAARGVKYFRLGYFLPYAIPGVIAAVMWSYMYHPNLSPFKSTLEALGLPSDFFLHSHMLNFSMSNMTAWTFVGYNMIIFMATLKSVPHDLYEAARIDGASEWRIVREIKIPLLKNALLMTVLMSIIGTVQWFNEPIVMGTMVPTVTSNYTPMMLAYQEGFSNGNLGGANAISVLMAIIAGILALIYAWAQSRIAKD